jgi:G3E family GTPase
VRKLCLFEQEDQDRWSGIAIGDVVFGVNHITPWFLEVVMSSNEVEMARRDTPTRFIILGGFLGAGKTTLAVNLGRYLKERHDKSVAIITNDQGDVLVDTEFTKDAGFDVQEVLGGCFCANFDDFVKNARSLVQMSRPDVIIAEPIGTSTNILATVVSPLRTLYPDEFEVAPLMVVVDGTQAKEVLEGKGNGEKAGLIPSHQVREAEVVIVSKMDRMSEESEEDMVASLGNYLNGVDIIPYSSVDGRNLDTVSGIILSERKSTKLPTAADNSQFAGEKASLGWYGSASRISPDGKADVYDIVTSIIKRTAVSFDPSEIAHVKVVISSPELAVKVSLVGDSMQVDGLKSSRYLTSEAELVVNARVISPPERLSEVFRECINTLESEQGLTIDDFSERCFEPKPEAPSYFFKNM